MELKTEILRRPDTGAAHFRVVAHGETDVSGIKHLIQKIVDVIQPFPGCGTLVDMRDTRCKLHPMDLYALLHEFKTDLLRSNRIAFVSPPEIEDYDQLYMLTACLWSRGLNIDVFHNIDSALEWLNSKFRVSTKEGH